MKCLRHLSHKSPAATEQLRQWLACPYTISCIIQVIGHAEICDVSAVKCAPHAKHQEKSQRQDKRFATAQNGMLRVQTVQPVYTCTKAMLCHVRSASYTNAMRHTRAVSQTLHIL